MRTRCGDVGDPLLSRKASSDVCVRPVPETDTGGQVEYTKALERSVLKELGKLPPYLRKKEALIPGNRYEGAQARG